jgi:hypothetical protein
LVQTSRSDIGTKASPNEAAEGALSPDSALWLAFETASDMMSLARVEPGPRFRVAALNATCRRVPQAVAGGANPAGWVGQTHVSLLSRIGYDVTFFDSALEALARFSETPARFDLVLTDLAMPDMTGTELAKAIRERRPGLPILLCTG